MGCGPQEIHEPDPKLVFLHARSSYIMPFCFPRRQSHITCNVRCPTILFCTTRTRLLTHILNYTHTQISTLESILQSAQGTLRTLLGEGAETPHRKQRPELSESNHQTAGCGEGKGEGLVVREKSSPAGLPSSRNPAEGGKGSPLITTGPRRVNELLLPPRRVPGPPWSLSQAVRNNACLHVIRGKRFCHRCILF